MKSKLLADRLRMLVYDELIKARGSSGESSRCDKKAGPDDNRWKAANRKRWMTTIIVSALSVYVLLVDEHPKTEAIRPPHPKISQ